PAMSVDRCGCPRWRPRSGRSVPPPTLGGVLRSSSPHPDTRRALRDAPRPEKARARSEQLPCLFNCLVVTDRPHRAGLEIIDSARELQVPRRIDLVLIHRTAVVIENAQQLVRQIRDLFAVQLLGRLEDLTHV